MRNSSSGVTTMARTKNRPIAVVDAPTDHNFINKLAAEFANGCSRKVPHDTKQQANKHMADLSSQGERGLNVYHCFYCNKFHVGHKMVRRNGYSKYS